MMRQRAGMMVAGDGGRPQFGPGPDSDTSSRAADIESLKAVQATMQRLIDIGSSTHAVTLAAIALCEERRRHGAVELCTPRLINQARYDLAGLDRPPSTIRESCNRLSEHGLVEKIDMEPQSVRSRYDWRLSDDGRDVVRLTQYHQLVRRFIESEQEDDEAVESEIRTALQDMRVMNSLSNVVTFLTVAVLETQDVSPINGPRIAQMRRVIDGGEQSERTTYRSVSELERLGFVTKRDVEPETDRSRFSVSVSEKGWRLLMATGKIDLVRELARLVESDSDARSGPRSDTDADAD